MSRYQLHRYVFVCENCKKETNVEARYEPQQLKGWVVLSYSEEGGGHYGLPHHHSRIDYCPNCKDLAVGPLHALPGTTKVTHLDNDSNYKIVD
jgi:hypothetical protein